MCEGMAMRVAGLTAQWQDASHSRQTASFSKEAAEEAGRERRHASEEEGQEREGVYFSIRHACQSKALSTSQDKLPLCSIAHVTAGAPGSHYALVMAAICSCQLTTSIVSLPCAGWHCMLQ